MKKKVVVITSHYFQQPAQEAFRRLDLDCDITLVPYDNFEHISQVYERYAPEADGFLVSGSSARSAIVLSKPRIQKPIAAFQVDSDSLYREMLLLALENRQQDFSRVVLDFLLPLGEGYTVEDFVHRSEIKSVYEQINRWIAETGVQELGGAENAIMAKILELWINKSIDMVICAYSSIVPALEALNIPYRCPFLSDHQLETLVHQVLAKAELQQLRENLPAIIHVLPRHRSQATPEHMERLGQKLRQFLKDNLLECVLQQDEGFFQLMTTVQTLRSITANGESCPLGSRLSEELGCPIVLGYGVGTTVNQALSNAISAVREAKSSGGSFIKDESGSLIGPLGSPRRLVVNTQPLPDVGLLARRCGLSTLTVQKLMACMEQSGSNRVTTPELASRFGTTVRNANRILSHLREAGFAAPAYTQTSAPRGRPLQVYELDLSLPLPESGPEPQK